MRLEDHLALTRSTRLLRTVRRTAKRWGRNSLCALKVIRQIIWMQIGEVNNATDECASRFWEANMYFNETSTDVLLKDLTSLEFKTCPVFPQSSKHQKLLCYSRVGFLTCLFVWASDELIGTGTDWLLLREGGNFSVILWLIIALKYVTVPTPSEVFDRRLWCVFTQAGRQTDSYLAPTP